MILALKYRLKRRLDRGWDPVSSEYARKYSDREWRAEQGIAKTLAKIAGEAGALQGKRVLDLGAGPGQFSVAFALAGAKVTWHDPSRNYESIARRFATQAGVELNYSQGYLEDAVKFASEPFDIVFNRVCWYYSRNDRRFADMLYKITKPGGIIYVEANTDLFYERCDFRLTVTLLINRYFGYKIEHVHPPRGRIARLLMRWPLRRLVFDYTSEANDEVIAVKASQLKR